MPSSAISLRLKGEKNGRWSPASVQWTLIRTEFPPSSVQSIPPSSSQLKVKVMAADLVPEA